MKKFLIILAAALLLSGCGDAGNDTEIFSLTSEQESDYKDFIAEALAQNSWSYNPDTIVFSRITLPGKEDNFYKEIDRVTSDGALTLSLAGKEAVEASLPLQHINGDNVGNAYFYFNSDKPVCQYYTYKDTYYSLSSRNPFELNGVMTAYENTDIKSAFTQSSLKADITAVSAVNNGIAAVIAENNTVLYHNGTDNFKTVAKADYTGRGLIPLDVTLGDKFGTILLGEKVKVQQNENENEVSDTVSEPPAKSVSIAITNSKGKPTGTIIPATVSSFTSLTQVGDRLFFARDKSIDEFIYKNGTLEKASTYVLDHYVSKIRTADIDGNGTTEFIVSDGTNIYIYEKTSTFNLVWRSNSYLSTISGNIYSGDLNNDGIKELYITDSTGVTARYILTEQGFKISGGGIVSGSDDIYIIADFNNDGKDDYAVIPSEDKKPKIYTAK